MDCSLNTRTLADWKGCVVAEIRSIEQNVDEISDGDRRIILVGTAHVSRASADLVERIIRQYQPDTVAVELCQPRFESLKEQSRWQQTNISEVIRSGRTYVLLTQLLLMSFQKRLADQFDVTPGEEMHRAISVAEELGYELDVIDRDIKITLKRAWSSASIVSIAKLGVSLIASLFTTEEISEDVIEELKQGDALLAVMSEFGAFLPGVKSVLIDERDKYMAEKLRRGSGKTVVAIVGAGHVPGMKNQYGADIKLAELEEMPPPNPILKTIVWGVPLLALLLITYGFIGAGAETGKQMVIAWILANGALSALGAAIALAHPLTIVAAFIAAPITSLNPTIAAGWVAGLVEAILRKPRVVDLENISSDVTSLKGFWKNRVTKVLLVVAFANLGSMLGTIIGFGKMASLVP